MLRAEINYNGQVITAEISQGGMRGERGPMPAIAQTTGDLIDAVMSQASTSRELATKVDKVSGHGLFSEAEKSKLAGLESSKYKGLYSSVDDLGIGIAGEYADVDEGIGADVVRYIWDVSDAKWVYQSGKVTQLTGSQIKEMYEQQPDTFAFTGTLKSSLESLPVEVEGKVSKEVGKVLVEAEEVERLSTVENYDDTILREHLGDINRVLDAINGEQT